ncbi:MAG: hypothetical protein Q4E65_07060 [Clostridia bacterium]|nr:hypothetical protein [Clostridia bacterium]
MENKNAELVANQVARKHKPLCFYVLAVCNELLFLLYLWLFLCFVIPAWYGSFVQHPPAPMAYFDWKEALKFLGVCVILMMAFIYLLRANGKQYRPTAYIFLLYAALFSRRLLSRPPDTFIISFMYFALILLVLALIGLYIHKSKNLKAYFGEE